MEIDLHVTDYPILGKHWPNGKYDEYSEATEIRKCGTHLEVRIPMRDGRTLMVDVLDGEVIVSSSWNDGRTIVEMPGMKPMCEGSDIDEDVEPEHYHYSFYLEDGSVEIEQTDEEITIRLPVYFDNVAYGKDIGAIILRFDLRDRLASKYKAYLVVDPQTREVFVTQE